ncbi:hypothetical protein B296_00017829 [Ensete ventricosum]|uniref:Uncharacterized protein n=1 Tax=Ensete ventricosum TaxID=4639 RepID=A0A427A605_ENSVE|nr:hypothetical protein B296_00017829 [Ensete ventricosum]
MAVGQAAGGSPLRVPRYKRLRPRAIVAPAGWPQPIVPTGGYRPLRTPVASLSGWSWLRRDYDDSKVEHDENHKEL